MASRNSWNARARDAAVGGGSAGAGNRLYDQSGNITFDVGPTVPSDGTAGYAIGAIFVQNDAATGPAGTFVNGTGTATSSAFTSLAATNPQLISLPITAAQFGTYGGTNQQCILWTAPSICTIGGALIEIHEVAGAAGSGSLLKVATGTTAIESGTSIGSGVLNLTGTARTAIVRTLTNTNLAAGTRVGIDTAAASAVTGYIGTISFNVWPR